jgi:vancomycin aglycone glucosyltransferase
VYVGFGSMRAPKDIARVAIEVIRAQGRRALLSRGWAGLAPVDDRDDCFAVGEVNQQALFGRVAAVVHHGGAGTTTTAARAGAPQVVIPQMADQPYWAGRVAGLGIGTAHDGPAPTTGSLSAALRTALTPQTRARAAAVAGTIRTDGATVAATLLLDAVSRESRQRQREPRGTLEPGTPRTREPASPGDLNRQRPQGSGRAERLERVGLDQINLAGLG